MAFRVEFYLRAILMLIKQAAAVLVMLALAGCDPQRISQLEEGVATEDDVRSRFGRPDEVWDGPGGERILEYDRQPSGHQNYMIAIGPDGRMRSLRQVLHPASFAKVLPGMPMEQVRRMLGRPMKKTPYALKNEVAWDWRYLEPPNQSMVFTAWFDPEGRLLRTSSAPDPEAIEHRGR